MKKNQKNRFLVGLASLALLFGFASCTPEEEIIIDLSVQLTSTEVTATSLTVKVEPKNAEKCYIDYAVKGEKRFTLENVKAEGEEIGAKTTNHTISELTPETTYVVAVVVTAGDQQEIKTIEVTTAEQEGSVIPEDAIRLNMVVEAFYRTGDPSGNGNYQIVLGNTTELGWDGDVHMTMDLYNVLDEDPLNAVLPNGVYEAAADKSPFTYIPDYTYINMVRNGEEFASPVMGTITVDREGPNYSILIEGMLIVDQTEITVYFEGPIQFVESVTATWTKFEETQNISFENSVGRYLGGWFYPFADDLWLELRAGEMNDYGEMVDGYYMQLSNIYIPKLADYNADVVEIPNGTYTVMGDNPMHVTSYAQPYTFDYGYEMDFYGTMLDVGAYVTHVDVENNIYQKGYITCGSFTVSGSGNNYTLDFDLYTEDGVNIKASYTGPLGMDNYNDNDYDELWNSRPWTTLTEDHVYDFKPETEAYAFLEGDYIKEGLDTWLVMIMASNDTYPDGYGDFFTTELLVPVGAGVEFPTGTFDISWDLGANVMIPGFMSYAGSVCFTYYGDLTPDAEGYSAAQAAIADGSVTISKEGEEYKFVFDLVDGNGKKVTGEWQGAVEVDDLRGSYEPDDDDHDHDHDHAPSQNFAPMRAMSARR